MTDETGSPAYLSQHVTTADVVTSPSTVWVLVCASGFVHVEAGGMPTAETERCAIDAAAFMDEPRSADSPWECGPHTVREGSI